MAYVYIQNDVVVEKCVVNPYSVFNQSYAGLFVNAPDEVEVNWLYIDGRFIKPPPPSPSQIQAENKQQAESLLQATDWVEVPSVSDTANTPHLVNYAEFITYRLAVRAIAVKPPVTVSEWPTKPEENWSSV